MRCNTASSKLQYYYKKKLLILSFPYSASLRSISVQSSPVIRDTLTQPDQYTGNLPPDQYLCHKHAKRWPKLTLMILLCCYIRPHFPTLPLTTCCQYNSSSNRFHPLLCGSRLSTCISQYSSFITLQRLIEMILTTPDLHCQCTLATTDLVVVWCQIPNIGSCWPFSLLGPMTPKSLCPRQQGTTTMALPLLDTRSEIIPQKTTFHFPFVIANQFLDCQA